MRYMTRQPYQSMQEYSASSRNELTHHWEKACEAYEAELADIKPRLPPGMSSFAEVTLHDGVVKSTVQSSPDRVELRVDATNNPWGPRGWYRVEFLGVREVEGLIETVGDYWLYEEVHLHPLAGFEYCVLLHRSEFRIVADEVFFETLSESREMA